MLLVVFWDFSGGSDGKESACNAGDPGSIPGWKYPLEKGMAAHSSILAWRIPWPEETGGLQSRRLLTSLSCARLFCDALDYSPPGSSVHGILQARILEWVAIPFSRGSS